MRHDQIALQLYTVRTLTAHEAPINSVSAARLRNDYAVRYKDMLERSMSHA